MSVSATTEAYKTKARDQLQSDLAKKVKENDAIVTRDLGFYNPRTRKRQSWSDMLAQYDLFFPTHLRNTTDLLESLGVSKACQSWLLTSQGDPSMTVQEMNSLSFNILRLASTIDFSLRHIPKNDKVLQLLLSLQNILSVLESVSGLITLDMIAIIFP